MTFHRKLLIAAILATSAIAPVATSDAQISISIGDRPYYNRGPYYWHNDVRYVWVPGHRSRHNNRWVRGRYVARERRGPIDRLQRRHRQHRNFLFGR